MKEQGSRRRLDPPFSSFLHLSSHHSFLSLPLMSVLSISSQCELVAIIHTHTLQLHYITHILLYPLSFCDPLCARITDWFWRRPVVLSKALELLVFTMW